MKTGIKVLAITVLLLLYGCASLKSQNGPITLQNASKRMAKKYAEVKRLFAQRDYTATQEALHDLLEREPTFIDGYLLKAAYYLDDHVVNFSKAKEALQKAVQLDSLYDKKALFSLSKMEYENGNYAASMQCLSTLKGQPNFYKRYRTEIDDLFLRVAFAKKRSEEAKPELWHISSMHAGINTLKQEAFPTMNAGWTELFFGRINDNNEDIYYCIHDGESWSEAKPLDALNTPSNESTQTLSSDGKTLLFANCHKKDGYGSCDIYGARRQGNKWGKAQNLGPQINSPQWESQPCLAEDGKVLLFASDRPGGFGGKDLYYSIWTDSGWSNPKNLGAKINTPRNEGAPFLHYSGQALYFMSDGHLGMGKQDLFLAKGGLDHWDTVLHLPPPINTHLEQTSMIVSMDGTRAIYASEMEEKAEGYRYMNLNLMSCSLPLNYQAPAASYVSGRVTHNGKPLAKTKVEIYALEGNYRKQIFTANDGEFLLSVPFGHRYGIIAEKDGFLMYSSTFNLLGDQWLDDTKYLSISMQDIQKDAEKQPIVLQNIFFDTGESRLKPSSYAELNRLRNFLEQEKEVRIEIQGHTDNVGADTDNLQLSQERAEAVKSYLVHNGISKGRIEAKGYGETRPIADNTTPIGRQQNRRTSFLVLTD